MTKKKVLRAEGTIRTTGELREFLLEAMIGVGNGTVDAAQADAIIKLAKRIHESLLDEIKMAKVHIQRGEAPAELGKERLPRTD
jgi:hypothetical protein